MRVLFISQLFLPEMGALPNRLYPLIRQLVTKGHQVFVATGMPNYPRGVIFPGYTGHRSMREEIDGYTVLRQRSFTAPRNQAKKSQLRSYLSFIPAAFRAGLRAGKVDAIVVTSPPLFTLIPAIVLAKLRRAKLVVDIRDLWPDELVTYGGIKDGSLPIKLMKLIERVGYRAANAVMCTTPAIADTVIARGARRETTFVLPNGADLELFQPMSVHNEVAHDQPFRNRIVVMYAGLFGIKHSLEVLLEAAALLRDQKQIVFCLVGNGARRDALKQEAAKLGLDNVIIKDEVPVSELPSLLARADICFAAVRPEPYPRKVISVKVFEYLACAKPVVGALSGESARVLNESGGGLVVPPGDANAVAGAILELANDPVRRELMGQTGLDYVRQNYSRGEWAVRFEQCLQSIVTRATQVTPVQDTRPAFE